MPPLVLIAGGVVALVAGFASLRSLGPGYRVGRLLAVTPLVSISEATQIAAAGDRRYVAIEGRIDSDDDFEDAAHTPLVLRRTRLASRVGRRWSRFEEGLEVVPFEIRDAVGGIVVDTAALGDGLVVMSRVSRGIVRDLGDRAPQSLPPDAPALVTIDQVSSVEHARVLGCPTLSSDGRTMMTAGLGRPLILSTLESGEAMRVLAGERLRPRLAAAAFTLAALLLSGGLLLGGFLAASSLVGPAASIDGAAVTPAPTSLSGDTRSSGEGPGLVGAPGLAILVVVALGLVSAGATLVYVRATGGPRPR